jgi:hypothetical protein
MYDFLVEHYGQYTFHQAIRRALRTPVVVVTGQPGIGESSYVTVIRLTINL